MSQVMDNKMGDNNIRDALLYTAIQEETKNLIPCVGYHLEFTPAKAGAGMVKITQSDQKRASWS